MKITEYTNELIEKLIRENQGIYQQFEQQQSNGILIYGAGFVGNWAAEYMQSCKIPVPYFIDRDSKKWGTRLAGIEIIAPEDERIKEYPYILIAARHAIPQVMKLYSGSEYTLMPFEGYYCIKNYQDYSQVRDQYLCDEKSFYTYNALLYTMLTGKTDSCLDVMEKDMYFGIPEFSGNFNEAFVDAGAFVGDSVERFIWENLGTFKHIYAFEPGEKQFHALEKRMERLYDEWSISRDKVSLEKAGLSDRNQQMSCIYTDDDSLRHALSTENGNHTIDTYRLDDYLNGAEATFLKVDIEGMEMEFLRGAEKTIRKYRPKMALCAYHYPCDLYCIAQYVKSLDLGYQFKLRLHAPFFGDFVLYCY